MIGKKRLMVTFVTFFFCVFLFNNSLAQSGSSYKSDFVVDGCTLGEKGLAVGACSRDGQHFCKASTRPGARPVLMNTLIDPLACSFGAGTPGATQCCPSGYTCDPGTLKCVQRPASCGIWTTEGECKSNSCTWIDRGGGGGVCVDKPTDFSCSVYNTQSACTKDVWNLGSNGIGTDVCGTTFSASYAGLDKGYVVAPRTCGCVWDSGSCKLSYEIADDIYNTAVEERNSVECLKSFVAGACVSGSQQVNWSATTRNKKGFSHADFGNVLSEGECSTGFGERTCGEPVFKLPGFSAYSFILSILVLLGYYTLMFRKD